MSTTRQARAVHAQAEREKRWEEEYHRFEADRELRRAKISLLLLAIRRRFGVRKPAAGHAPKPPNVSGSSFLVPIDQVIGRIDEHAGSAVPLSLAGRGVPEHWRRAFFQDDERSYQPLRVLAGASGWYLTGGPAAVIQMEVLRAKGHRTVRVVRASEGTPAEGAACPECEPFTDSAHMPRTAALG